MSNEIKPFSPATAIAWIEASRTFFNRNNTYGKELTFAETVEILEESDCNEQEDYRALKALEQMREQTLTEWLNGLSAVADAKAVAKIQQTFG